MESEELFTIAGDAANFELVKHVVNTFEPDVVVGPLLMDVLNKNQLETRTFLAWAAKHTQAKTYLEIGTRRGWSAGVMAAASPDCELYCFDIWEENYSSSPNPGPEFVTREIRKLGYTKDIHFVNGDSHQTVPKFFSEHSDMLFDVILVDGDHTVDGAFDDLKNVMGNIAVGGVLVFDDIVICERLDEVFYHMKNLFPNFEYHAYTKNIPGVGVAIRTA